MSLGDTVSLAPARMSIANVSTGQSIEAQFNPTEFEEALEIQWARFLIPGLSHQPIQFFQTGNVKFPIELYFQAQDPTSGLEPMLLARRFLQSLCYPRRGAGDILGGAPPRALFVWPNLVSLTCVITSLAFRYAFFNVLGTPTQLTAKLALEEIRDVRLFSEDVLERGSQRSGVLGEGG
jgi:hypothetical protein